MMPGFGEGTGGRNVGRGRAAGHRVGAADVAVHAVGIVVSVAFVFAYSVVTVGDSVDRFAGLFSAWILPILTLPTAALTGLLVGLLFAGMLGGRETPTRG